MGRRRTMVTVNCPTHHEALVNGLWNCYETRFRTDLNYLGGGQSYRAHRLIVEVFLSPERLGQYFKPASACNGHPETVPERGGIQLDCLLEFLYKGRVTVRRSQLKYLLTIAKELNLDMLAEAVEVAVQRGQSGRRPDDVVEQDLEMVVDDDDGPPVPEVAVHESPVKAKCDGSSLLATLLSSRENRSEADGDTPSGYRNQKDDSGQSGDVDQSAVSDIAPVEKGTPRRTNRKRQSGRVLDEMAELPTGESPQPNTTTTNHKRGRPPKRKRTAASATTEEAVPPYMEPNPPASSDPPVQWPETEAYPVQLHASNEALESDAVLCRLLRMSTEKEDWMLDRPAGTSLSDHDEPDEVDLLDSTAVASQAIHVMVSELEVDETASDGAAKREPCECSEYGETLDGRRTIIIHRCARRHQCHICGQAFFRLQSLERHALTHIEPSPIDAPPSTATGKGWKAFVCDVCQKAFRKRATYNRHLLSHTSPSLTEPSHTEQSHIEQSLVETTQSTTSLSRESGKRYHCPECSRVFQRYRMFEKHLIRHADQSRNANQFGHADQSRLGDHSTVEQRKEDRRHTCDVCGKVFQRLGMYVKHRDRHARNGYEAGDQEVEGNSEGHTGPYTCVHCNGTFKRLSVLQRHVLTHAVDWDEVDAEEEGVDDVPEVKNEMVVQVELSPPEVDQPFRCGVCGLSFAMSQELDRHSRSHGLTWVANLTKSRTSGGGRPTNVAMAVQAAPGGEQEMLKKSPKRRKV